LQGARDAKEGLRGILLRLSGVMSGAGASLPDFVLPPCAVVDGHDSLRIVGTVGPQIASVGLRDAAAAALRAAIPCTHDPDLLSLLISVRPATNSYYESARAHRSPQWVGTPCSCYTLSQAGLNGIH
jgi:hypothetical protein